MYVVLNIDERWQNVAHRKFSAHTDFKKLEGTLFAVTYVSLARTTVGVLFFHWTLLKL